MSRILRQRLYDRAGTPSPNFNRLILGWLDRSIRVTEHTPPAAFEPLRQVYRTQLEALQTTLGASRWDANRLLLTNLTDMLFGIDIASEISTRLTNDQINVRGFRTALAQGVAKNTGENFTNVIVYALADALSFQDEILVEKGVPPVLRQAIGRKKIFVRPDRTQRQIEIPIEGDLCIFSRTNQCNAIMVSGKTRLKEIFHIAVMWKFLLDAVDDRYCQRKWGLEPTTIQPIGEELPRLVTDEILYVFATADMISSEGVRTQGGDVERPDVRNLIAMDAAFMDYVFVSKSNEKAQHISASLNYGGGREALFHEMGCLLDLVQQKFGLTVPQPITRLTT
jgi:hypothetical protein